jgi:hypothetical protein
MKRIACGTNMVQYLVHHYVRAEYFQNKKQKSDAAKHVADFEKGWAEAMPNERKTFEVIKSMTDIPKSMKWDKYEPLELGHRLTADHWFSRPEYKDKTQVSVFLPNVFMEKLTKDSKARATFFRDAVAAKLGIPVPN